MNIYGLHRNQIYGLIMYMIIDYSLKGHFSICKILNYNFRYYRFFALKHGRSLSYFTLKLTLLAAQFLFLFFVFPKPNYYVAQKNLSHNLKFMVCPNTYKKILHFALYNFLDNRSIMLWCMF